MDITPISVDALPEYTGLDGKNADTYYMAGQRSAFIYNEVIGPFEQSLKDSIGFSEDNMPGSKREIEKLVGDYGFQITVTPTTKRPGYKEVFSEVDGFLRTKLGSYSAGERPVGIITIDGEPYISLGNVLSKIRDTKEQSLSKGVSISIAGKPDLPEDVFSMVVPLGMDISELNEGNVQRYLEALKLSESYGCFISAFENDLIGMTGFSDENPPQQTENMYRRLGDHIFHVKSVPFNSTSWGKVIGGLDKKPPKRKTENGGDLTLIESAIEMPRLEIYGVRTREREPLIRLNGIISRIDTLVGENTETKVRQKPINHYPIV
ncbi:MAG: hypothetical protein JW754_03890 [Candidatus Aenigmarchaeota archaeon]|nr:hypothetical protein [Candidatus Aenigmarchaeota archaeon]